MSHPKRWIAVLVVLLCTCLLAACGPSLQSTVQLRCGENLDNTFKGDKCVIVTGSEGDCPIKVTVNCAGQSPKSTTVQPNGDPGKLCCNASLGKVSFEALGTASGKCKFTYGRD